MSFKVGNIIRVTGQKGFVTTMWECWKANPIQKIIHINTQNDRTIVAEFSHTTGGTWCYHIDDLEIVNSEREKLKERLMK